MSVAIPEGARVVFSRPELLVDRTNSYCPGCGHGVVHRLIAEVLGDLDLGPRTIAVFLRPSDGKMMDLSSIV